MLNSRLLRRADSVPGRVRGSSRFMTDPQVLSQRLAYPIKWKAGPTCAPDEFIPMLRLRLLVAPMSCSAPRLGLYGRAHDSTVIDSA
jgi:hypothetical protein